MPPDTSRTVDRCVLLSRKVVEMIRTPVSSSDLASVGYDPRKQLLEVEFHSGGTYQYSNVPADVYEGLMQAGSHGRYFHAHIKDLYPCHKIV